MPESFVSRDFFVAGGTLRPDAPSYVERPADRQLRELVQAGELCYVLTTRQMGKSSLVVRTAEYLTDQGVHTGIIDLTLIGSAPIEEWYLSLLDELHSQLPITTDPESWWEENSSLSCVRRFTKYIQEVIVPEVGGRVVIFIDEVDSVLNLEFADDFFAAIRAMYNRSSSSPEFSRVSFVLLGVAAPNDLIRDQIRTPFNIGARIKLDELAFQDAEILTSGLPGRNRDILERIFFWTNGHPYLTQKIGSAIAQEPSKDWTDAALDGLVSDLFFTDAAFIQENNLQFVNRRILSSPHKIQLIRLYRMVCRGKKILGNEQSPTQNELRLYGLIGVDADGYLKVRNRIYQTVFDEAWIQENSPVNWWRRAAIGAMLLTLVVAAVFFYYWQLRPEPNDVLAESYVAGFLETANPTLRLGYLADLFVLGGYDDTANQLFLQLPIEEQIAIFENSTPDLLPQIRHVVVGTYASLHETDLSNSSQTSRLLQAMVNALGLAADAESRALRDEIRIWLQGRNYYASGELAAAKIAYDLAVGFNDVNPATRFERAVTASELGDYETALTDLTTVWDFGVSWESYVLGLFEGNDNLRDAAWSSDDPPPFLALLPIPTPQVTSTTASTPSQVAPSVTASELPPTETHTATAAPTMSSSVYKIEIGQSVLGKPLEVFRLGDGPLSIMLIGGLSAGYAPSSVELAQMALDHFSENPGDIPEEIALYIFTSANPDSVLAPGELDGRLNANGVDLNRNWDCNWMSDTEWIGEVYTGMGGSRPFSEPETRRLADFIRAEDMRAVIFWTARAQNGLVSLGRCGEEASKSRFLGETYGEAVGYPNVDFELLVNTVVTGDATNWLDSIGIPAISVLLPSYSHVDWASHKTAILATLNAYAELVRQELATPSPTATRRATITPTVTRTRIITPTPTSRAAQPPSPARPTATRRPTVTPLRPSPTSNFNPTVTPTVSLTPDISVTLTVTPTTPADITSTPVITITPTLTSTPNFTGTPSMTTTPDVTNTPDVTTPPEATVTPEVTNTPEVDAASGMNKVLLSWLPPETARGRIDHPLSKGLRDLLQWFLLALVNEFQVS